jgi:WhiB family redox-sensing transcriptional regulator
MTTMNDIEEALLGALQVPVTDERPWMVFAACREQDPDLFFPQTKEEAERAIAICRTCPVRSECREYSLEAAERFGVWGGLTEKQRLRLLRQPA